MSLPLLLCDVVPDTTGRRKVDFATELGSYSIGSGHREPRHQY